MKAYITCRIRTSRHDVIMQQSTANSRSLFNVSSPDLKENYDLMINIMRSHYYVWFSESARKVTCMFRHSL
jgi:hypothetical protein